MYVNKKVCEDAGVEIPGPDTTWEQFMETCQKIKDAGYTPIAASLIKEPHYWFEYSIFNHDTPATHVAVPEKVDDKVGKAWAEASLTSKMFMKRLLHRKYQYLRS